MASLIYHQFYVRKRTKYLLIGFVSNANSNLSNAVNRLKSTTIKQLPNGPQLNMVTGNIAEYTTYQFSSLPICFHDKMGMDSFLDKFLAAFQKFAS